MATVTLMKPLPEAPSRAEGPVAFNAKADPFIAALPPFVVEFNSRLAWVAETVTAAEGYKDAAAVSAKQSTDSAGAAQAAQLAAEKAVTDAGKAGAAQVQLAQDQVALSMVAKVEAQAAAQAAGAAAGLPSERVPYSILQVTSNGHSAWGARDRIGEVITAVKAQDASYIQTGGVYLQASYPELFQLIGKLTTPGVYSFQGATNSSGYTVTDLDGDGNGTWVAAVTYTSGTGYSTLGYVLRSVDDGKTWTPVTIANLRVHAVKFGAGVWVCAGRFQSNDSYHYYSFSSDGGATWAPVSKVEGSATGVHASAVLAAGESGRIVLIGRYADAYGVATFWASVFNANRLPNGVGGPVWSNYAFLSGLSSFQPNTGTTAATAISGIYSITVSDFGKINRMPFNGETAQGGQVIASGVTANLAGIAAKNGTVVAVGVGVILRSSDDGLTFRPAAVSGSADFRSVEAAGGGVWIAGTSTGVLWISVDDGFTFTQTTPSGVATAVTRIKAAGNTVVLNSGAVIRRSDSLYSYDQNTQFIVPAVAAPSGLKSFIKAREAA